jgi:hypothetical protein
LVENARLQKRIDEKNNQSNHGKKQLKILPSMKIAPTKSDDETISKVEDYDLKYV